MRAMKASKLDILFNVGLPRTMPYFFASLKVAVTQAFVGTVIAETVASNRGIGNLMMIASSSFDVPLVFAGLIILAALGVGALRHLLLHRRPRDRLGPPQGRIRHGLSDELATTGAVMLMQRGLLQDASQRSCLSLPPPPRRTRPRSSSRSTGSSRASMPGTTGRRRRAISPPRSSTSRSTRAKARPRPSRASCRAPTTRASAT